MANVEVPPGARLAWERAEKRLEAQMRQADSLDTKAGVLVGLHAVAAALVATIATKLSAEGRLVAIGVIAGLVVSGSLALLAYRVEAYGRNPSRQDIWRFASWEEDLIRYRFIAMRFAALERNADRLTLKAKRVSWSLTGLALVALAVAVVTIVGLVIQS